MNRYKKLFASILLFLATLSFWTCNVTEEKKSVLLNIKLADSLSMEAGKYDTLRVDILSESGDTLMKKVYFGEFHTGQGQITGIDLGTNPPATYKVLVSGYKNGEKRVAIEMVVTGRSATPPKNIFNADTGSVVPIQPVKPEIPFITLKASKTTLSIKDSVSFTATAKVTGTTLKNFSWDFNGDGIPESIGVLTGDTAEFQGGYVFPVAGDFKATLKVFNISDSSSYAELAIKVLVDIPIVNAGFDISVYTGATIELHGIAHDSLGQIVKTEWKIGTGAFQAGKLDTGFAAPGVPMDLPCVLKATDDDGQSATDTIVIHVVDASQSALTNIGVSAGLLSPQFNPATLAYSDTVNHEISTLLVTPTGTGSIKVNDVQVASGSASSPIGLVTGNNTITISVQNTGKAEVAYVINVFRHQTSSDANLSALSVSVGSLNKPFNASDTAYIVNAPNSSATITITASSANSASTLKINGTQATSGMASAPINLAIGENLINIVVTAQGGTVKSYQVKVLRAGSANSNLSALLLSTGSIAPAFSDSIRTYSLSVANGVTSTLVTASTADPAATLAINGQAAVSGTAFPVTLSVGANMATIVVTSQDGGTTTYAVQITRASNGNSDLSALAVSAGTLAETFSPATVFYSLAVGNAVTATNITATTAVSAATLSINGAVAISGTPVAVNLDIGSNAIPITVTAANGDKKTYSITITRAANADANLSGLAISAGTLSPALFNPATLAYSASVANSVTSTTVTATVSASTSKLSIQGTAATSGTVSAEIPLATGSNSIPVVVTAENGVAKTYTITITRALNGSASLTGLVMSAGALSPVFGSATLAYTASVANNVTSTTVTATTSASTSTLTIRGVATPSGSPSAAISLVTGANSIPVVVTSESGATATYSIVVTRALNADANLSGLVISAGTLSPVFGSATLAYTASVGNNVTSTTVTGTLAVSTSVFTIRGTAAASGTASASIPLVAGSNSIPIVVTSESGATKTYTITITRGLNADANLSDMDISAGTLSPAFNSATIAYTSSVGNNVTSTTVTAIAATSSSTLTVKGTAVPSGTASGAISLVTGSNSIPVVVTAESGATKTYTITVTRAANADANLSALTVSAGSLSPAFSSSTLAYTVYSANNATSTTVTATTSSSASTLTINGAAVTSGAASGSINLASGNTSIPVIVTAQSGATRTYNLTVVRSAPDAPNCNINTPPGTINRRPTWSWSKGTNGGTGSFRYKMDNSNLNTGATLTSLTSYIPSSDLSGGAHTLYVQDQDALGNWSASGSKQVLIVVPSGMKSLGDNTGNCFVMGSDNSFSFVGPAHQVCLDGFHMDTYEVTQGDYQTLMGINPSTFSGSSLPVNNVTWFDAILYSNKRSKRDGLDTVYRYTSVTGTPGNGASAMAGLVIDYSKNGYRLPTEAEWEYACRAGRTSTFYWGEDWDGNYYWHGDNSTGVTHPVGQKLPNDWGLHDMIGNVFEWVNDWYSEGYYNVSPGNNPIGPNIGPDRGKRGLSFDRSEYEQSYYRDYQEPGEHYPANGFRLIVPKK